MNAEELYENLKGTHISVLFCCQTVGDYINKIEMIACATEAPWFTVTSQEIKTAKIVSSEKFGDLEHAVKAYVVLSD